MAEQPRGGYLRRRSLSSLNRVFFLARPFSFGESKEKGRKPFCIANISINKSIDLTHNKKYLDIYQKTINKQYLDRYNNTQEGATNIKHK